MSIPRNTATRIIYWNIVLAVLIVLLGGAVYVRRLHRYDRLIVETGREYGMDPRLISCIIWKESRFDPSQIGGANEVGLMQITELVALEWAIAHEREPFNMRDFFNPQLNIRVGTWHLKNAWDNWAEQKDPLPYALAEYNAGHSNAKRWADQTKGNSRDFWEGITYPTTKRYVRDILKRYRGGV